MTYATSLLRNSFSLLCAGSLFGGCVVTGSDGGGDGTDDGDDDGGPGPGATGNPDDDGDDDGDDVPDDTSGEDEGETGDEPVPCGTNVLEDPGFEGGTPNAVWDENSLVFDSPICDAACTEDPGAEPLDGDWWLWFGGLEEPEIASVSQVFSLTADVAELQFSFSINAAAGGGEDIVQVHIDETEVFMATDAEAEDFDGYTAVTIDISDFADGEDHTLTFSGDLTGVGLTNFFIDNTAVSGCDDSDTGTDTGTGTGDTGADTTAGSDSGSSDSGSSDSGSSDSGSSDSGSGSSSSTGT